MNNLNENTPLAILTVGQFLELIEERTTPQVPEIKEKPREDRTGIDEISKFTGLSNSQIYKLTSQNKIPHRKFGKRLVFSRKEVKQWLEEKTVEKLTSKQNAAKHLAKLARNRSKRR
jgi:excisionase family DNA binding protein